MMSPTIPVQLAKPAVVAERVVSKMMQDLTVYVKNPLEQELEYLIDLYESVCPPDCLVKYKITELQYWASVSQPVLTSSGREASVAGKKRPYLEPVRQRIRDGRAFEIQFWDERPIGDLTGSWSFSCRRIHHRSSGLHAFVRLLLPLEADFKILREAAIAITDNVELYSGHGGLVFVYDPLLKEDGLDVIYTQARRFWGVDVEDLNETLPLMKASIKGVNWITVLGSQFGSVPEVERELSQLATVPEVIVKPHQHGLVLLAGPEPVVGDQHRIGQGLEPYYAVANALKPLFLLAHPDFSSERWIKNGNTVGWIRRFINPNGWR